MWHFAKQKVRTVGENFTVGCRTKCCTLAVYSILQQLLWTRKFVAFLRLKFSFKKDRSVVRFNPISLLSFILGKKDLPLEEKLFNVGNNATRKITGEKNQIRFHPWCLCNLVTTGVKNSFPQILFNCFICLHLRVSFLSLSHFQAEYGQKCQGSFFLNF